MFIYKSSAVFKKLISISINLTINLFVISILFQFSLELRYYYLFISYYDRLCSARS